MGGYDLRCPACGYIGDIDSFDVMGADDGNLFCNQCGHEAPMELVEDNDHDGRPVQ